MTTFMRYAILGAAISLGACGGGESSEVAADDLEASAEAELTSAEELADDEAWANTASLNEPAGETDMVTGLGRELVEVVRKLGDCSFQYGYDGFGNDRPKVGFFIEDGDDSVLAPGKMFAKKRSWGVKYRATLAQDPHDASQKYVAIVKVRRDTSGKIKSIRARGIYRGPGSAYARDRANCRR